MLRALSPHREARGNAHVILRDLGTPTNDQTVDAARIAWLSGQAEAQDRATLADHPRIAASGLPLVGLLNDELVAQVRIGTTGASPPPLFIDSPFLIKDTRLLSDVIDTVIADIQASGDWNEDIASAWFGHLLG